MSEYTIKNTAAAVENFAGMGLSLLEISHRSKEFVAVNDEARALIKELLDVPAGYEVVFMGGGASMQFCMVPYNLLNKKASYLDTGNYSALLYGVNIGGLGTLIASLASIISYRGYCTAPNARKGKYILVFTIYNLIFLAILSGAAFLLL